MNITLLSQVPSQKNSKIVGTNRFTGKTFVTSNRIVKDWQEEAAWQLKAEALVIPGKVVIDYTFYMKDKRRRDLDNMVATVNDALVKAGVIEDDSWQLLEIGGARGEYDKLNPRVVLNFYEAE